MARSVVEPASPVDAFNPPDNRSVIMHDDATAQAYKAATANARQRQASGLAPEGAPVTSQPAGPSEPALPMTGVANAYVGRHLRDLRTQADALERDIQRGAFGVGGNVTEYLVARVRESRKYLEDVQAEISRISALDDLGVRKLAFSLGAR